MNNNSINLLVDKRSVEPLSPIVNRLKLFRLTSFIILFGTGAISIILSILIVFSPISRLKDDVQKAEQELAGYSLDINKLSFVNDRGDSIRKLLDTRSEYDKKLSFIQSQLPSDVSLDEMSINKKDYTLKISSKNLESINQFIENMVNVTGSGKEFLRAYLSSLSVDELTHRFLLVIDLRTV